MFHFNPFHVIRVLNNALIAEYSRVDGVVVITLCYNCMMEATGTLTEDSAWAVQRKVVIFVKSVQRAVALDKLLARLPKRWCCLSILTLAVVFKMGSTL